MLLCCYTCTAGLPCGPHDDFTTFVIVDEYGCFADDGAFAMIAATMVLTLRILFLQPVHHQGHVLLNLYYLHRHPSPLISCPLLLVMVPLLHTLTKVVAVLSVAAYVIAVVTVTTDAAANATEGVVVAAVATYVPADLHSSEHLKIAQRTSGKHIAS